MAWVDDCAWLQQHLPEIVTQCLPALVQAAEDHRRELTALAQIVTQMETEANQCLQQLIGLLDDWREEVEPRDDTLRRGVAGVADVVAQVLAGLQEARQSMAEDASTPDFGRLTDVVNHAAGLMTTGRASVAQSTPELGMRVEALSAQLLEAGTAASAGARAVLAEIAPVYRASQEAVGMVTSRMEAIGESASLHFERTTTLAAAPSIALQASTGEALDRLGTELEQLASQLVENPREIGETLQKHGETVEELASALHPLLMEAAATLPTLREGVPPAAEAVGAERVVLVQLTEAVRDAATLVSVDWGAVASGR